MVVDVIASVGGCAVVVGITAGLADAVARIAPLSRRTAFCATRRQAAGSTQAFLFCWAGDLLMVVLAIAGLAVAGRDKDPKEFAVQAQILGRIVAAQGGSLADAVVTAVAYATGV